MFNSQCAILNPQPGTSVRIRIEHWELNIGQIPIGHSDELHCLLASLNRGGRGPGNFFVNPFFTPTERDSFSAG